MFSFSKALLLPVLLSLAAGCSTGRGGVDARAPAVTVNAPAPAASATSGPEAPRAAPAPERTVPVGIVSEAPPGGGRIPATVTRAVAPGDPLRLMIIGDSLADGFGIFMKQRVSQRGLPINVTNLGKTSTGLARGDFYDWPGNFAGMAASQRPDVVVVHFGANDDQPLRRGGGGSVPYDTPEWDAAYRAEARRILDTAARYGAVVYWLGPAPDRDAHRNALLTKANRLFREEARGAGAHFISLPRFAAGPNGEFAQVVNGTKIRTGDGSHFNVTGYFLVVDQILKAIERDNPGIFLPPGVEVAGLP